MFHLWVRLTTLGRDSLNARRERAADPCYLADGAGKVLWLNHAAQRFCQQHIDQPRPTALCEVFSSTETRSILTTPQYGTLHIETSCRGQAVNQAALIINFGSGDPDEDCFVIVLKCSISKLGGSLHQEELLAAVVHDLKNPLGAIFGYADTLLDSPLGESLCPAHREVIAKIRGTSARSIDLVKNYEHLFQLQTAVIARPQSRSDLNHAVRSVAEYSQRGDNGAKRLVFDLAAEDLTVRLERAPLERIVSNLLSNALKYSPATSQVLITTRHDNSRAMLQVNNGGAPISAAEQETVFNKYTRASTGRHCSGSGLGLFIVKTTVESVGGKVALQSDLKNGTTFTIWLPCA